MTTEIILGHKVTKHETKMGTYWIPDEPAGDYIGERMRRGELFDEHVFNILKPYINSDSVVLDIGSNFGQLAIEFSKIAKTVHAFEAHPFIHEVMSRNFKENSCNNIVSHVGAVWDDVNLELFYPEPNFKRWKCLGSHGIEPYVKVNDNGVIVKSLTIDSLNLNKVDVVKIDIQGSDLRAMKGMVNTIQKYKPIIIFEFENDLARDVFRETKEMYLNFVKEINYKIEKVQQENYLILPN